MGNPEAAPSAYALHEYRIADDLGGEDAWLTVVGVVGEIRDTFLEAEPDSQLLQHELGALARRKVDAVGVDVADALLKPQIPRFFRDLLVDELADLVGKRRPHEPRELLVELDAVDETIGISFSHDWPIT